MLNPVPLRQAVRFNHDNHLGYEMLDGDVFPVPFPAVNHQSIALKVASALLQHVEASKLGRVLPAPCSVILSRKIVMHPDILFIKNGRRGLIGETGLFGAPDLVIEILSPVTRKRDLEIKKKIYSRFEVQEYWVVDPDADTAVTMVWSELGYISVGHYSRSDTLSSPLLPKLNLQLADIFEEAID